MQKEYISKPEPERLLKAQEQFRHIRVSFSDNFLFWTLCTA
jgi:hypothetical protein